MSKGKEMRVLTLSSLSFFSSVFQPFGELSTIFVKLKVVSAISMDVDVFRIFSLVAFELFTKHKMYMSKGFRGDKVLKLSLTARKTWVLL